MIDEPEDVEIDEMVTVNEEEEVLPFRYSITSYGADYPVDSLVNRIRSGAILVPEFQRGYVWTLPQASRFIESLLLGLPVPGIFLSREPSSGSLLVIDGQQRLLTLKYFYSGKFESTGRVFALGNVQEPFVGLTYDDLDPEDRLRLDDSIVHATIVKQESPEDDESSIYHVFERLNTGATPLSPQEIRSAIYHGSFNSLLHDLNENPSWRDIFGPPSRRMRDQELILRFLSFRFGTNGYFEPLKGYLNNFMHSNTGSTPQKLARYAKAFGDAISVVHKSLGNRAFRPAGPFNAAVFDSVMVGTSRRLARKKIQNLRAYQRAYDALLEDQVYLNHVVVRTGRREAVERRLEMATAAFAEV